MMDNIKKAIEDGRVSNEIIKHFGDAIGEEIESLSQRAVSIIKMCDSDVHKSELDRIGAVINALISIKSSLSEKVDSANQLIEG